MKRHDSILAVIALFPAVGAMAAEPQEPGQYQTDTLETDVSMTSWVALALLENLVRDNESSIPVLQGLGDTHAHYGDLDRVRRLYEQALANDTGNMNLQKRIEALRLE